MPTLSTFNARMSGCKYFSKVDLRRAYHQIPVHPEHQIKSTINTTLGLFKFKRMPYGLKNAGACFQRNINLILNHLNSFSYVYMDDVIIFSQTPEEHIDHLKELFQTLSKHRILVNMEKCIFAKDSVTFLGHKVSSKGISIPKDKVDAILNYPKPVNVKDLEKFLGLYAFLHRFIKNASEIVNPLQELRKAKSAKGFLKMFADVHLEAFEAAKVAIAKSTLLAHPRDECITELWTDASDYGMGATLVQLHDQIWRPLAFWSKSFNHAQRSYAAFDKEMLAISYSVQHFRNFIEGQQITVRTDHKPLVFALTKKSDLFTPLQRRHLSFISQFIDKIYYRKGEENIVADTLSRIPESDFTTDLATVSSTTSNSLPSPIDFRKAQDNDKGLQEWIKKHSSNTTNFKPKLVPCADAEVTVWADGSKSPPAILVPTKFQRNVFDHFHNLSHSGFKSCFKLIKTTHYWPNSRKDIKTWCQNCPTCQRNKINRHTKTFLKRLPQPNQRFGHIHIDLIKLGNQATLLTIVDRWTGWPEAIPIVENSTAETCAHLLIDHWISRFGVPHVITTDRGRQFTSRIWTELARTLGIKHDKCSSYHPQHNGKVERMHRSLKNALRCRLESQNDWKTQLGWVLLGLRNAPHADTGLSAAQLVYGQSLDIPGQLAIKKEDSNPTMFGQMLNDAMASQKFNEPLWHGGEKKNAYIPTSLYQCPYVLVRNDAISPSLSPHYNGPFKVLERDEKTFKLQGCNDRISVDRLIPFHGNSR